MAGFIPKPLFKALTDEERSRRTAAAPHAKIYFFITYIILFTNIFMSIIK
jgi:hypothetical protein